MSNKSVILITGTSKGLGYKLAEYYSKEHTVVGFSRSGTGPGKGDYRKCDLTQPEEISLMVEDTLKRHSRIDVLINNAAVLKTSPLMLMTEKDIRAMVDTNFLSVVLISKSVFKPMLKQKFGRIINIISMSHKLNVVGDSVYAATKAGVEAFSKILNKEGHLYGITVNNIGLSAMPSGMLDQIVKDNPDKVRNLIPHGDYADLGSLTHCIDYFRSEKASDIGGQSIYLGGI